MSLAELLAILSTAWTRLLLYPAGLTAFAVLWLVWRVNGGPTTRQTPKHDDHKGTKSTKPEHRLASKIPLYALWPSDVWGALCASLSTLRALAILAIALPWLGLALMPLPLSAAMTRPVDVIVLLSLLEWPRLLAAAREFAEGKHAHAAAMLNSYPPLILALLLMHYATGSFEAQALLRAPGEAMLPVRLAFWAGALALLFVLPAALGIGPFRAAAMQDAALRLGLKLRALGIAALGLCPWLTLIPEDYQWLLPVPMLLYGVLLWQFHRRTCGQAALPWARSLYLLSIVLLLGLLLLNGLALIEQLR